MKIKLIVVFIMIGILFGSVCESEARPKSKKIFKEMIEDDGKTMQLQGTSRKWAFLMKIFTAGLYLDEQVSLKDVMSDVAKKIEVHYHYPIPGKKLSQYTKSQMRLNLSKQEFEQIQDRIIKLDKYFVDLKPGDRYALSYLPGKGTKFIYNDKEVGLIEGADFAKGIFAVWIGDKPMDRHVKNEILGIKSVKPERHRSRL